MGFHWLPRYDAASLITIAVMGGQLLIAQAARADPVSLDEVIVTARKMPENLQEVPGSISVLSETDLAASGVSSFADLVPLLPNVAMGGGIAGVLQGQLGIRGISTLQRNIGVESGVGVYIDGVHQGRSDNYNQEFIDVERVEVLRGPQGTLFGKNTIAGVFNIVTRAPTDTTQGNLQVDIGNFGLLRANAFAAGPVSDGLGVKVAAGYMRSQGTVRHLSGGQDGGAADIASFRGGVYFTARSGTTVTVAADGLRDRGRPAFFQASDLAGVTDNPMAIQPRVIDPDGENFLHRDNSGLAMTVHHDLDFAGVTSVSSFRRSAYDASLDDDQSQLSYLSKDVWSDSSETWTQEFRLEGEMGSRLRYVAGLYYLHQEIDTDRTIAIGSDFGISGNPELQTLGSIVADDAALFGSIDWDLGNRLTLALGTRLSFERKRARLNQIDVDGVFSFVGFPSIDFSGRSSDRDLSPTASLLYQVSADVAAYARVAKGFKGAAFNIDLASSKEGLSAGPETAVSYEVGLKSELIDHRLRANLSLFTTDYDNMQVSQLLGSGPRLENAGAATIRGAEIELTAALSPTLKAVASIGVLDPTYDTYPNCAIPLSLGGGSADCSGNQIIGAPRTTRSVALEYQNPLAIGILAARVEYAGSAGVFEEATNSRRFRTSGQEIFNVRLGLITDGWNATLWCRNMFDKVYTTYHDDRSAIGVRRTTAYGAPRTVGITLSTGL